MQELARLAAEIFFFRKQEPNRTLAIDASNLLQLDGSMIFRLPRQRHRFNYRHSAKRTASDFLVCMVFSFGLIIEAEAQNKTQTRPRPQGCSFSKQQNFQALKKSSPTRGFLRKTTSTGKPIQSSISFFVQPAISRSFSAPASSAGSQTLSPSNANSVMDLSTKETDSQADSPPQLSRRRLHGPVKIPKTSKP